MSQYSMEYREDGATQRGALPVAQNDNRHGEILPAHERPRREIRFRVPSILKTAAVFASGAAVLFTWETYAPEGYRLSTFMGIYDARIAATVKAAELNQQVRFEQYAAQLKLAAEQQAEQYRAAMRSVLDNYTATYEINKVKTQALMDMQGRLTATLVGQKTQEQGMDIGIINLARGFGRVMNGLQPGAGEDALKYADGLSGTLQNEIIDVTRTGVSTQIAQWDTKIASPAEVAAILASIKPFQVPTPPSIGEARAVIGGPVETPR